MGGLSAIMQKEETEEPNSGSTEALRCMKSNISQLLEKFGGLSAYAKDSSDMV